MDIIRLFDEGFPLTKERLEFLQLTYTKAFSQLIRLAGSGKIIIEGAVNAAGTVSNGIIITSNEIMEFRGGAFNARVAVFEEVVNVPYNVDNDGDGSLDLKVADTVRFAQCASAGGDGSFLFSELKKIGSVQVNTPEIGDVKTSFNLAQNPNWLLCNGAVLYIANEPDLYAILGVSFGTGGAGTFRLPNYQNKTSVGAGGDYAIKTEGGEKEVTLSETQMPSHNHVGSTDPAGNHRHGFNNDQAGGDGGTGYIVAGDTHRNQSLSGAFTKYTGEHTHSLNISNKGGGAAHNNMQPFIAINHYIFKGI